MGRKAVYESLERFEQTMRASVMRPAHDPPPSDPDEAEVVEAKGDVTEYPVTKEEMWDYVSAYATKKSLKVGQSVLVRATCPEAERIISTIKAMAVRKHGKMHATLESEYNVEPVQTNRLGHVCRVTRTK